MIILDGTAWDGKTLWAFMVSVALSQWRWLRATCISSTSWLSSSIRLFLLPRFVDGSVGVSGISCGLFLLAKIVPGDLGKHCIG